MNEHPYPWNPPEGVFLTTLGEVRRLGGKWEVELAAHSVRIHAWNQLEDYDNWSDHEPVFARRKPEPLIPVLLPRSEVGRLTRGGTPAWRKAAREALARHDGAQR